MEDAPTAVTNFSRLGTACPREKAPIRIAKNTYELHKNNVSVISNLDRLTSTIQADGLSYMLQCHGQHTYVSPVTKTNSCQANPWLSDKSPIIIHKFCSGQYVKNNAHNIN